MRNILFLCSNEYLDFFNSLNRIGCVMVSVLAWSVVDRVKSNNL